MNKVIDENGIELNAKIIVCEVIQRLEEISAINDDTINKCKELLIKLRSKLIIDEIMEDE